MGCVMALGWRGFNYLFIFILYLYLYIYAFGGVDFISEYLCYLNQLLCLLSRSWSFKVPLYVYDLTQVYSSGRFLVHTLFVYLIFFVPTGVKVIPDIATLRFYAGERTYCDDLLHWT